MNSAAVFLALLALAVPGKTELATAWAQPCAVKGKNAAKVTDTSCRASEEPTEFVCSYTLPTSGGGRREAQSIIARDGTDWVLIDGYPVCFTVTVKPKK